LRQFTGFLLALAMFLLTGCAGTSTGGKQDVGGGGNGPGQLTVTPSAMNFGDVAVGNNSVLTGTLAAGSSDITVSSAAWNGEGYSVGGITFPVTVTAGQSVHYTVTFAPQSAGSSSGSITFDSNATNSPSTERLNGDGTQQQASQYTVALSWNASAKATGYNVYRGTVPGGPYSRINSALNSATSYTDTSVQSGLTYYYVTTAVDSQGGESAYSNQAQAVIPN
jgi:cellulose 1,4-beta-cellobiosidase